MYGYFIRISLSLTPTTNCRFGILLLVISTSSVSTGLCWEEGEDKKIYESPPEPKSEAASENDKIDIDEESTDEGWEGFGDVAIPNKERDEEDDIAVDDDETAEEDGA